MEGSLVKRGNNLLKDWRERWVELVLLTEEPQAQAATTAAQVRYYRTRDEARAGGAGLGRVPLARCTVRPREGGGLPGFELETPSGRVYAFRTRSDLDRQTWLDAIRPYSCPRAPVPATTATGASGAAVPTSSAHALDSAAVSAAPTFAASPTHQDDGDDVDGDDDDNEEDDDEEDDSEEKDGLRPDPTDEAASAEGSREVSKRLTIDVRFRREGHLSKLGNNLRSDWRIRWFVLNIESGTLDYYAHQGDDRKKGSIGLLTAAVSVVPNRKHCFSIVTSNRSYCVTADNEAKMKEWMEAIQATHTALLNHYQEEINGKVKMRVLMAGHLTKQGKNVLGDWRRRWCILRTDALHYYKSESDTSSRKEMGKIGMLVASVKQGTLRRYSFEVITPARTYHFQASSHEEMFEWINKIREASESLLNALPLEPSGAHPSANNNNNSNNSAEDDTLPRKGSKALALLFSHSANQLCADCDQPEPRWASVNLGVFVCIECSGIHRSLGVHNSRVRSVDLDVWDVVATQSMESIGNQRAKEYWEHHVPAEWLSRKPVFSDDREKKEEWIKAKYIDRLFVRPEWTQASPTVGDVPLRRPSPTISPRFNKEGWLSKQSSDSSWKQRWFCLRDDGLFYYKSQEEETPAGVLQLSSAIVRPTARQLNAFEILTNNRVYHLRADSEEELEEWVALLARALARNYHSSSFDGGAL